MSDFLDCLSLQNCCFILWYMKKTKTKTTANSELLFCKLSIYKLLDYKWRPLGIVYGSPLACWCLIIKTQGFSEEKKFFPNQKLFLSIFTYRPDSSVPRNSVSKFFKIQCRFHCISFTVASWLPWHISPASVSNYPERWASKLWWHCKYHSILPEENTSTWWT